MKKLSLDNKPDTEETILLYHGSKSGIRGPVKRASRENCDFGKGFYMCTHESDSFSFVCSDVFPNKKFYNVSLNLSGLKVARIDGLRWLFIVIYNRGLLDEVFAGTKLWDSISEFMNRQDVLIGPIADDSLYEAVENFIKGYYTDVTVYKAYTELKICEQVVAVSDKACNRISVREVFPSDIEIEMFRQARVGRIAESKKILNNLPVEYRRLGRFLEEYRDSNVADMNIMDIANSWSGLLKGD